MNFLIQCFVGALLLLPFNAYSQDTIYGRVVGITDGDTLTLLSSNQLQTKVRLSEIDTPESKQPFGSKSKQFLSRLAFGKDASVEVQDEDRYGRTVGRVYIGDTDVNREIVRNGFGWVYKKYLRDQSLLDDEASARARKVGIWSLPETEQIPPWEWRQTQRAKPMSLIAPKQSYPDARLWDVSCCKNCSKGKPCGDSCIAKWKTCHKGPGCAC